MGRRVFGEITKLPSGRYRARYRNPEDRSDRIGAPRTFRTKESAEEWLVGVENQIIEGTWKHPDVLAKEQAEKERQEAANKITVTEWVDVWLNTLEIEAEAEDRAKSGVRSMRDKIRRFKQQYGDRTLQDISDVDLEDYWDWLRTERKADGRPLAASTRNDTYLAALSCMRYAHKKRRVATRLEPRVKLAPREEQRPLVYVATPEEIAEMEKLCSRRVALAVMLAYYCGLRSGEIRGLRSRDLTLGGDSPELRVRQVAADGSHGALHIKSMPKSTKGRREIPLTPLMVEYLKNYLWEQEIEGPDDLLIHAKSDPCRPVKGDALLGPRTPGKHKPKRGYYRFHEARRAVGLHESLDHIHQLRKCFLTRFGRTGATLQEIMTVGGHDDVNVAMIYQVAERERIRDLISRM